MDELDRSAQTDFHIRLSVFLREELSEETAQYDHDGLMALIAESEARAATHGVVTELGVTEFVILTILAGTDFDEDPYVRAYLREPDADPDARLDELVDIFLNTQDN